MSPCRHCKQLRHAKCRGLCSPCYDDPAIKAQYPPLKACRRGEDLPPDLKRVPTPTDATPGSEAKIRVLIDRLWSGCNLWHPGDNLARREHPGETPVFAPERRTHGIPSWADHAKEMRAAGLTLGQVGAEVGVSESRVCRVLARLRQVEDGRPAEYAAAPPWLAEARRLRATGATLQEIAHAVGVSRQRVQQVLPGRIRKRGGRHA